MPPYVQIYRNIVGSETVVKVNIRRHTIFRITKKAEKAKRQFCIFFFVALLRHDTTLIGLERPLVKFICTCCNLHDTREPAFLFRPQEKKDILGLHSICFHLVSPFFSLLTATIFPFPLPFLVGFPLFCVLFLNHMPYACCFSLRYRLVCSCVSKDFIRVRTHRPFAKGVSLLSQ